MTVGIDGKSKEHEVARNSERWGFWALPIGVLAIIVTVFCTIWTVRRSEAFANEIAERDKPKAALYIGGLRVEGPLALYYRGDFAEKSLTVVEMPLAIRNEGDKTLRGLELLIREPSISAVPNDVLEVKSETRLPISILPERHFVVNGGYAYTSFALPELHPGQAAQLGEPLRVIASQIRQRVEATSKDGVPLSLEVLMTVDLPVQVSIAGEDMHPADFDLSVFGVKAKGQDDILVEFIKLEEREREQFRRYHGFFAYWFARTNPAKRQGVLISPEYQLTFGPNGERVDLAKSPAQSTIVSYTFP